jgi:hypothetical protein
MQEVGFDAVSVSQMTAFSPSPLPCDSGTQPEVADSFHACLPTRNIVIKARVVYALLRVYLPAFWSRRRPLQWCGAALKQLH